MARRQEGFVFIEGLVVVILILGLVGAGYLVWQRDKAQMAIDNPPSGTKLPYHSPDLTTAPAPSVTTSSDLGQAVQTLSDTSVSANATDNTQLGVQSSAF